MKVIRIEDAGHVWEVPLEAVAKHRATYYAENDKDTTFEDEMKFVMEDDNWEGLDWFQNNMDFEDVEAEATLVKTPDRLPRPDSRQWKCEIGDR